MNSCRWSATTDRRPAGRLVIANGGARARCIARYPEHIDQIALSRDAARRMIAGSFAEYGYGAPEADYPSDHCPQSVTSTAH